MVEKRCWQVKGWDDLSTCLEVVKSSSWFSRNIPFIPQNTSSKNKQCSALSRKVTKKKQHKNRVRCGINQRHGSSAPRCRIHRWSLVWHPSPCWAQGGTSRGLIWGVMQTHQFWVEAQSFETRSPSTSLTSTWSMIRCFTPAATYYSNLHLIRWLSSAAAVSAPKNRQYFFGESPQGQVGSVVILSVALGIYL